MSRTGWKHVQMAKKSGLFDVVNNMPPEKRVVVVFDPKKIAEDAELKGEFLKDAESLAKEPKEGFYAIREEGDKTGVTESAIAFCPGQYSYTGIARLMQNWHDRIGGAQIQYI